MSQPFDPDTVRLLAEAREIQIETARDVAAPRHRTTIWIVVDEQGRPLIRSVDGSTARWFREAVANPAVTLRVGKREIPASAVLADDDERIEAASRGYRAKYPRSGSTASMLASDILSTTIELVPR
jgi:hypothetical protein